MSGRLRNAVFKGQQEGRTTLSQMKKAEPNYAVILYEYHLFQAL